MAISSLMELLIYSVLLLGLVYLGLSLRELKRRGRHLSLVRFQRLRSGKLLVLNTLFLFVICVILAAVISILAKWRQLKTFVHGEDAHDLLIFVAQQWTLPLASALLYTFSNVAAALQLRRHNTGFESIGSWTIFAHNGALVGGTIVYLATTIVRLLRYISTLISLTFFIVSLSLYGSTRARIVRSTHRQLLERLWPLQHNTAIHSLLTRLRFSISGSWLPTCSFNHTRTTRVCEP
jgi:hypothetical protein